MDDLDLQGDFVLLLIGASLKKSCLYNTFGTNQYSLAKFAEKMYDHGLIISIECDHYSLITPI